MTRPCEGEYHSRHAGRWAHDLTEVTLPAKSTKGLHTQTAAARAPMSASQQSQPPTQRRRDPVTTVYTHAQLLSRARELRRHAARTRQRARELRGEILRIQLPVDHSCSARARRLLEKHLSDDLAATLEDAKLIASELVTNAFIHGGRDRAAAITPTQSPAHRDHRPRPRRRDPRHRPRSEPRIRPADR